jgi:ribonuclease G
MEQGPAMEGQVVAGASVNIDLDEPEVASSEGPAGAAGSERDFRGRRRRRGRRGEIGRGPRPERGEIRSAAPVEAPAESSIPRVESGRTDRFNRGDRPARSESDSRFQRPTPTARVGRDYDYGPPPGYQPMVLPGESISKYQRQGLGQSVSENANENAAELEREQPFRSFEEESAATSGLRTPGAIEADVAEDAPIFTADVAEPLHEQHQHVAEQELEEEVHGAATAGVDTTEIAHKVRVLAELYSASETTLETPKEAEFLAAPPFAHDVAPEMIYEVKPGAMPHVDHEPEGGAVEEQEIEEEEADLTSYGEEPGDDEGFEELEEETRAAGGELSLSLEHSVERVVGHEGGEIASQIAAGGELAASGEALPEAVLEAEEREAEELELEEAQAEAEALLEAEAIGQGTVDASAELRGPATEARLLQRTQRRAPERGSDRGRGRRGGGRRFRSRENTVVPQISELLKEGQEVLIQIAKEPIGKKGARITSHIALPGRFLVFMPTVNHTGVSRKIASEEERQRLKRIIQSERENGGGGFIVRTAAAGASDEELRADIRFLKNLWNEIKSRSDSSKPPALIYHDLNVVERVLRDQVSSEFSAIWVDTEQEYERIVRFANRFQPGLVKRVKLYTKETPLYDQFGLNEEINKALKSKVWLKSGGYIVINQTEALVAIDVNTGKYVGKTARLEDTIVKTNVDAIKEIVRQVRLRDLGGIIIIDFIDMDERRNRQKVMQALEEALRLDRAPSKVLQFNDFGLVAITRKRVKQSLERTIGTPCPYCQSTGFVKSVNTICNEVYVEMRKISNHLEHSDVMLRVNPEVAKVLKANNAKLLNEMEELTKKTIIVKSDPALHQEQFDIH